jgi:YcxB-like protein
MQIKTQITQADLVEFEFFNKLRPIGDRLRFFAGALVPPLIPSGVLFGLTAGHLPTLVRVSFLIVVPVYFALFYYLFRRRVAKELQGQTHSDIGDRVIDVEEQGVQFSHGSQNIFLNWAQIPRVLVNNSYGYIYTSPDRAIIVPQRCFTDGNAFALFMKVAVIYHWNVQRAEAEQTAPVVRPTEATTQQTGTSPMPALKSEPIAFVSP